MNAPRVLVVDDELEFRATVRRGLEREGYLVAEAGNGPEALALLRSEAFDLLLIDLYMSGMSGLAILEAIRAAGQAIPPAIMITGLGDWASYARAIELGVKAFLTKPVAMAELLREVAQASPAGEGAGDGARRR